MDQGMRLPGFDHVLQIILCFGDKSGEKCKEIEVMLGMSSPGVLVRLYEGRRAQQHLRIVLQLCDLVLMTDEK